MATPQELQRLIQELESKINNLAPNNAGFRQMLDSLRQSANNSSQLNDNLAAAQTLLSSVNKEIDELNDQLGYTFKSFQSIINELTSGQTNISNINKGVKSLTDTAQKLVNRQSEYGKLTSKELLKLQKQTHLTFENLRAEREVLEARINSGTLSAQQQILEEKRRTELDGILQANIGLEQSLKRQVEYAVQEQEAVEESLGLTGNLIKAVADLPGGSLSKFLNVQEATEEMEAFSAELIKSVKNSDQFKGAFAAIQSQLDVEKDDIAEIDERLKDVTLTDNERLQLLAVRQAKEGVINDLVAKQARLNKEATLAANNFIGKLLIGTKGLVTLVKGFQKALFDPATIFTFLVKSAGEINTQTVGLQKSLGVSAKEAKSIRSSFAASAAFQEDTFYNTERLVKAQMAFVDALGFSGRISADNAKTFAALTERLGIAADEAAKLQFYSEATGVDFARQKLDSYQTTSQIESQYGIHLNQKKVMSDVAKSSAYTLTQFGGSVTALTRATAEAQALGTSIEKINRSAEQLLNFESSIQSELEAEVLTGRQINLEQARYYALVNDTESLMGELNREIGTFSDFQGMNRIQQDAFAKSLGMSVDDLSQMLLMEQYRGQTYEQITAQAGEDVAKRVEALTVQERFNDAITKLQGMLADLVAGPLGTMAEMFSTIFGSTTGMFAIMGALVAGPLVKAVKLARTLRALSFAEAIAKITAANAWMGPAGIAVAGAAIAGLTALTAKYAFGDDVQMKPGYGKRAILSPEGSIFLNDKDTIIAGTNLGGGGGRGGNSASDETPNLLKQLIRVVSTGNTINLDGQAVGKALTMGSFSTSG